MRVKYSVFLQLAGKRKKKFSLDSNPDGATRKSRNVYNMISDKEMLQLYMSLYLTSYLFSATFYTKLKTRVRSDQKRSTAGLVLLSPKHLALTTQPCR